MTRPGPMEGIPRQELDRNPHLTDQLAAIAVSLEAGKRRAPAIQAKVPKQGFPMGLHEGRPAYGLTGDPMIRDGANSWLDF